MAGKASRHNGLTGDCRHRYWHDDKYRQKHVRPAKNIGFRHKQVDFGGAPVSVGSALIATYDAKHARDMDSSRLRYDDGPSERCRAADRKTQQGCRVAGLAPACADTRLHIRQSNRR